MPRNTSQNWSVGDSITAARLQHFNTEIDKILSNGDDRLKVWELTGLTVQIGAGNYRVGSAEGYFAGGTQAMTDDATNYVMLDNTGTIQVSTSAWNSEYLKLAIVTTVSGSITDIDVWRIDGIGGELGGYNSYVDSRLVSIPNGSGTISISHGLGVTPKKGLSWYTEPQNSFICSSFFDSETNTQGTAIRFSIVNSFYTANNTVTTTLNSVNSTEIVLNYNNTSGFTRTFYNTLLLTA